MKKSKHNIPNNLNCLSSQLTNHSPTLANIYGHPWNNWRETDTMNELRKAYMYDYSRNKLFSWRIWFVLLPNLIKLSHYLFCRTAHEREPISKTDWLEERTVLHSPIQYYDKRFLLQYSDILSVKHSKRISYNREYSLHLKCERLPL